jgi:hypothetical protein
MEQEIMENLGANGPFPGCDPEPAAKFIPIENGPVVIRNLSGFSGGYWQNLQGEANVDVTGGTSLISGTAAGYQVDKPYARTAETFTIKVSC